MSTAPVVRRWSRCVVKGLFDGRTPRSRSKHLSRTDPNRRAAASGRRNQCAPAGFSVEGDYVIRRTFGPFAFAVFPAVVALAYALAAPAAFGEASGGFLEGQLKIAAGSPVALEGAAAETAADYAGFPLIIRRAADGKEAARITADRTGKYRVALPVGDYILTLVQHPTRPLRTAPQRFAISRNTTTRVDVQVASDPRTVAPDGPQPN